MDKCTAKEHVKKILPTRKKTGKNVHKCCRCVIKGT